MCPLLCQVLCNLSETDGYLGGGKLPIAGSQKSSSALLTLSRGHPGSASWTWKCYRGPSQTRPLPGNRFSGWQERPPCFCNRVQPRRGTQIGICNGVWNSRCSGNIREKYIYDVLTPTSLSWGIGRME